MEFKEAFGIENTDKQKKSYHDMERIIQGIEAKSKFRDRQKTADGKEIIVSLDGEKFEISRVTDPNSSDVERIRELMLTEFEGEFKDEDLDSLETMSEIVGNDTFIYKVAKNSEGDIMQLTLGYLLKLGQEKQEKVSESLLFMGLTISREKRKGLGAELNKSVFESALEKAKKEKREIKAIAAAAVDQSEYLANRVGMKRIYFKNEEGDIFEVPYIDAPLNWNFETGEAEAEVLPAHFMLNMIDGKSIVSVEDFMEMVDAIYKNDSEINYHSQKDGKAPTKEAIRRNHEILEGIKNKTRESLSHAMDGEIMLLSKIEREKMVEDLKLQGNKLFEHTKQTSY